MIHGEIRIISRGPRKGFSHQAAMDATVKKKNIEL